MSNFTPESSSVKDAIPPLTGGDTVKLLAQHGAKFCRVASHNKNPIDQGWQNTPLSQEQITPHLGGGGNAGLLTGQHSAGLCFLDLDQKFSEFTEYFHLANAPAIVRAGSDRGKILVKIIGAIPGSKAFKGDYPLEFLSTGRQGVIAGVHPTGAPYTLVNAENPIPEFTAETLNAMCDIWTGEPLVEAAAVPEPRQHSGRDDLKHQVLDAWPTMRIFEHFNRAGEVRRRGEETKLRGNGGLYVNGDKWFCFADNVGGGPFEAWQWCKTGKAAVPTGAGFRDLLTEMALSAGLPAMPEHKNGKVHTMPPEPEFDNHIPEPPAGEPPADEPGATPAASTTTTAAKVTVKTYADLGDLLGPIEWAWRGWLPDGFLTILAGESGAGKSGLALRIAGCFVNGWDWPDETKFTGETGAVLWAESEAAQAVNLSRMGAWGLPVERVYTPNCDPMADFRLDLPEHRELLAARAALPEVKLIVVDSLRGALGRADENASDTINAVKWLAEMARNKNKPVILTHHLRKRSMFDTEGVGLERLRGSSAIVQTARLVWALDVPDIKTPAEKRLSVIKSNLGKFPNPVGMSIDERGVKFGDAPLPPRIETVTDKAIDLLLSILAREPVAYTEIESAYQAAGISKRTVDSAKKRLGIVSHKTQGGWLWSLPAKERGD